MKYSEKENMVRKLDLQDWIVVVICLLFTIVAGILMFENPPKTYNPSIECIEDYQFVRNFNNSYTQVLDSNGNGIRCK